MDDATKLAADRLWMEMTGDWPKDLCEEDAETLALFVQAFARHAAQARAEGREEAAKVAAAVELPADYKWSESNRQKFRFGVETAVAAIRALPSPPGRTGES